MADRDDSGRFVSEDKKRKKRESVTVHGSGKDDVEEFIESTQRKEGYTEDEAATVLEEALKSGDVAPHKRDRREGDPEKAKAAKRRLQDSGEFDDAVEALEQDVRLDEADAPEGEEGAEDDTEPRLDAPTLDDVSERLGVDPAEIVGRVKVDGEEYDVTLEEMAQGYQRTESYTRKTQELAQQRKQYQESLQEADALRAQAAKTLQFIGQATQNELSPQQRQRLSQTLQQVQQERAAIQAGIEQEVLPQEHEKLKEKAGWESPEEVQQAKELIYDTAQNVYGFEPNELDSLYDHRLMLVAYDAARYRQLQSQAGEIGENIGKGKARPTLKPGSKTTRRSRSSRKQEALNEKLSQTGSAKAAAELIESLGYAE